jgi:hypothetical protein
MKILGINSKVNLNGKELTITSITKKGVIFSNKLQLTLEDIELFIASKELVIL